MIAELQGLYDLPARLAPGEAHIIAALFAILAYVIFDDMRNYRVRNDVILALIGLFLVLCFVRGSLAFVWAHLLFGLAMFGLLLVMYRFSLLGGGDVKLLAVAFLWLGMEQAFFFSMALTAFGLLYSVGARLKWLPGEKAGRTMRIPFGPSIALAWALTIVLYVGRWL